MLVIWSIQCKIYKTHTVRLLIKIQSQLYTGQLGFFAVPHVVILLSCHLVCSSVRQEKHPTSLHLVSSSCYWTQPLSYGTSPYSTSKRLRYLSVICYFNLWLSNLYCATNAIESLCLWWMKLSHFQDCLEQNLHPFGSKWSIFRLSDYLTISGYWHFLTYPLFNCFNTQLVWTQFTESLSWSPADKLASQ